MVFPWRLKDIHLSLAHRVEAGEYESKAESDEENIVVPEQKKQNVNKYNYIMIISSPFLMKFFFFSSTSRTEPSLSIFKPL